MMLSEYHICNVLLSEIMINIYCRQKTVLSKFCHKNAQNLFSTIASLDQACRMISLSRLHGSTRENDMF